MLPKEGLHLQQKRTDHIFADRMNGAWKELGGRIQVEVRVLTTFFNSIKCQIGKLWLLKSGQEQGS